METNTTDSQEWDWRTFVLRLEQCNKWPLLTLLLRTASVMEFGPKHVNIIIGTPFMFNDKRRQEFREALRSVYDAVPEYLTVCGVKTCELPN